MSEVSSQLPEKKKIPIGFVCNWVFGAIFLLAGVASIFSNILLGIIYLIMAIILLPPTSRFIEQKSKLGLSRGVKAIILIIGIGIALGIISTTEKSVEVVKQQDTGERVQKTDAHKVKEAPVKIEEESVAKEQTVQPATSSATKQENIDNEAEVDEPKQATVPQQEIKTPPKTYGKLELEKVFANGANAVVVGNTDLPDGSSIKITFDVAGRPDTEPFIGVSGDTIAANGRYEITLKVPQREEFKKGSYIVSALFHPRFDQQNTVLDIVGKDGEKLSGNLVREGVDFKMLEITEKKNLKLVIFPPTYTFQKPSQFKEGTPERTLAEYIFAWKNLNWQGMAKHVTKTWFSDKKEPVRLLKDWHDFKTLYGFGIVGGAKSNSKVSADITYIIQYEFIANQISKKQVTARLIKETAPYTPSEKGQWGVNPVSALREEDTNASIPKSTSQNEKQALPQEKQNKPAISEEDSIIKKHCQAEWPDDFEMRAFCEKEQRSSLAKLNQGKPADITESEFKTIRNRCKNEWPTDFAVRAYCEKEQYDGVRALK